MEEVWKDIEGYEGLYQVSNYGRIKSFRQSNRFFGSDQHILKATPSNNGYLQITLYRNQQDRHKFLVHRLVAKAFIPNPNGYNCINHKDENLKNNKVDNLEWCTIAYNNAYGTARIRGSISKGQKVEQYTLEGVHLATYNSLWIASQITGISRHIIVDCCSGNCQTGAGYIWKYA